MTFTPSQAAQEALQRERHESALLACWHIQLADTAEERPFVALVNHDIPVPVSFQDPFDEVPRIVTFEPWPVRFDSLRESTDGSQPAMQLTIGNVDPALSMEINRYGGLRGQPVTLLLVSPMAAKPYVFEIESAGVDQRAIAVRLAASSMLDLDMPRKAMDRTFCSAGFQSLRCGYRGPETHCAQTFAACSDYGDREVIRGETRRHPLMFGGRTSMPTSRRVQR